MKKKILTRMAAAAFSVFLAAGMISGCGSSGTGSATKDGDKTLFSYNGVDVPLKEGWIYAKINAAQYEASYSSYFGPNFWTMEMGTDEDGNPTSFEDYVKEQTISQIKKIIILDSKAEEFKVSLEDKDKENCEKYAKAFAEDENGKAILKECGGTVEDIQKIYEDNALASRVQQEMVKDTDQNVSDDEARETTIARVVFETSKTDDQGKSTDMTDEEKAAVKAKADAAWQKLSSGTSIEDIAKENQYTNTSETFAAGESEEGEAFEKILAGLKDGDNVEGVQECENGYVIAKLTAYTDKDATASHKEEIISQRQQDNFQKKYEEWTADLEKDWKYKEAVDQELWAQVVLHSEESTATESQADTAAAAEGDTAAPEEGTTAAEAGTTAAEAGTTAAGGAGTETPAADTTTQAK